MTMHPCGPLLLCVFRKIRLTCVILEAVSYYTRLLVHTLQFFLHVWHHTDNVDARIVIVMMDFGNSTTG